ncbi:MAG: hypothetical protein ACSHX9_16940 [Luteolibacter sp.]
MKLSSLLIIPVLFLLSSFTALAEEKDAPSLDSMLDDRVTLNEKYRDDFAEEAESSPLAEDLVPMEKKFGDAWVNYLKYIRASDDTKLKVHALRVEFLDEIVGCYHSLEYADSLIEKVNLRADIAAWKKLLARLDNLAVEVREGE